MKAIKFRSVGSVVHFLNEILANLGYKVLVSNNFGFDTDVSIRDFQKKNKLVVDGNVGIKTWSVLIEKNTDFLSHNHKFLSEQDLMVFAINHNIELATIKAVNEIESSGKGFLNSGKPKILFEGHIFWKELVARGFDPSQFLNNETRDVLYERWTKKFYLGGDAEYLRLEKAYQINPNQGFREAANAATSWGSFQIMGFHAKNLGYKSVSDFVEKMNISEKEHLEAFGRFLKAKKLIPFLKDKNWAEFALHYNGSGYKANKYDEKLALAYKKYL